VSYVLVQQLAGIRDEYDAARAALAYLERAWHGLGETPERQGIRLSYVRGALGNLEITYTIRLFSAFESLLHHHLVARQPRRRIPRTAESLINRVALSERVPDPIRDEVHEVREYRNAVVHPGAPAVRAMGFKQAVARLNRFLAPLP
jgi:hypothetical protein